MADLTREEQFLSGIAEGSTVDLKPITRREQYLAKIAGQDVEVPDPITREEMLLKQIADGGGGGPSVVVEPITITENGVTTAPSGTAYSPITVNVNTSFDIATAAKRKASSRVIYMFSKNARGCAFAPYWGNNSQPDYVLDLNASAPKVILNVGTENEQIETGTYNGTSFSFPTTLVSYDDFPGMIIAIKQLVT